MTFIPFRSKGLVCGKTKPIIFKRKRKFFFLCSVHSALNLFYLKGLFLKAKSPFLHPLYEISSFACFKNRNIIILHKTLHILDFFIPTTRIFLKERIIGSVIFTCNFFLIFYSKNRTIEIFSPWKINLMTKIYFPNGIVEIKKAKIKKNKDIVFVLTKKNIFQGWNLSKTQCFFTSKLKIDSFIGAFQFLNNSGKIIFFFSNKQFLVYDILKNKLVSTFESKKLKKIKEIDHIIFYKGFLILLGKKFNLSYDKIEDSFARWNFSGHKGKIRPEHSIRILGAILTTGLFDNSVALHEFSLERKNFILIKVLRGVRIPTEKLHLINFNQRQIIMTNKRGLDFMDKKKKREKKVSFGDFKKKFTGEKNIISHFIIRNDFLGENSMFIILCFYKIGRPLIWNIDKKKNFKFLFSLAFEFNKIKMIFSLSLFPQGGVFLVGYEKNIIGLYTIQNSRLFKKFFGHHFSTEKKLNCFVRTIDVNLKGTFFVSGCSHGSLKLWRKENLVVLKNLKFRNKILNSKWCSKSDLIVIICSNNIIYIVVPDNFSIKRIFYGHRKLITDLCLLNSSKTLISSSLDKTIKIWDTMTSNCLNTVSTVFPAVSLLINKSETLMITSHFFTTGIGFWKAIKFKNGKKKNFFEKKIKNKKILNEKNSWVYEKKSLVFLKKLCSSFSFFSFLDCSLSKTLEQNSKKKSCNDQEKNILSKTKKKLAKVLIMGRKNIYKYFFKFIISNKYLAWDLFEKELKPALKKKNFFHLANPISVLFLIVLCEILIEEFCCNHALYEIIKILYGLLKNLKKITTSLFSIGNIDQRIMIETTRASNRLENLN